ncbi:4'-phosphopantetheinyl transferase family protein [Streptomyces xiaopingdaonensis]|uniref:4'-phosphopantetheinyl transferase family protein n=1 Tax=Streptomyces xiaopingdaonensis TaxID=1565415 RepID=UPI0002E584C1|nr:4'-phosphopantetheinyl transferase superfamily protein [Streptomyces xiaopingdaonensis]
MSTNFRCGPLSWIRTTNIGESFVDPFSVHLWAVPLESWADDPDAMYEALSPAERKRADAFVFDRHRRQYVISHVFLRRVLARYSGTPERELAFRTGSHGKPRLASRTESAGLEFNLSHCGELALVGLGRRPLGVDVETVREGPDAVGVAGYFHPAERRVLDALPPDRRADAFFRGWTRKESVVKAIGRGLSVPLSAFEVELEGDEPSVALARSAEFPDGPGWHVVHLEPVPGVVGALAVPFRPECVGAWLLDGSVLG